MDNKSENTGELNPEKEEFVGNFIKTAEIFEEINGDKFAGISYTENDEIFQNDGDSSENFFWNVKLVFKIDQLNSSDHKTRNNTEDKENNVTTDKYLESKDYIINFLKSKFLLKNIIIF